jgi:hypothetical protein
MVPPLSVDPRYVEARRVLLDALTALAPHGAGIIVAGAQAVYLRTGEADIAVAPLHNRRRSGARPLAARTRSGA